MILKVNEYNDGFYNRIKIYINGVHQRFITKIDTITGEYTVWSNKDGKMYIPKGCTDAVLVNEKLQPFDLLRLELEKSY